MEKETIVEAAKAAVNELYGCSGCVFRDRCRFFEGGHPAKVADWDCEADDFEQGFTQGAEWVLKHYGVNKEKQVCMK